MKTKNVKRILFNFIKLLPIFIILVNCIWVVVASNQKGFAENNSLYINDGYDVDYYNVVEYSIYSQFIEGSLDYFEENFLVQPISYCFDLFFLSGDYLSAPYYIRYSIICISWFIVVSLIELFVNAILFLPMFANKWLEGKL